MHAQSLEEVHSVGTCAEWSSSRLQPFTVCLLCFWRGLGEAHSAGQSLEEPQTTSTGMEWHSIESRGFPRLLGTCFEKCTKAVVLRNFSLIPSYKLKNLSGTSDSLSLNARRKGVHQGTGILFSWVPPQESSGSLWERGPWTGFMLLGESSWCGLQFYLHSDHRVAFGKPASISPLQYAECDADCFAKPHTLPWINVEKECVKIWRSIISMATSVPGWPILPEADLGHELAEYQALSACLPDFIYPPGGQTSPVSASFFEASEQNRHTCVHLTNSGGDVSPNWHCLL